MRYTLLTLLLLSGLLVSARGAAPALPWGNAEAFLQTVGDALLQQQLGLRLTNVQIAPVNQYDAAVHRVLQVTANIFDATSTNELPTVFRPWCRTNGAAVFLGGFTNDPRASTLPGWLADNPHRVPLIIAARKGFPAGNEFVLRSDFTTRRRLQVTRASTAPGTPVNGTNQMYILSLSNFIGFEAWNPHEAPYPRALTITVANTTQVTLTNGLGVQAVHAFVAHAATNVPAMTWTGGLWSGFRLPLATNLVSFTDAPFDFTGNSFGGSLDNFAPAPVNFPRPESVAVVSNALTFWMQDGDHLVDFAFFDAEQAVDLHQKLWTENPYAGIGGVSATINGLWSTNRASPAATPDGIRQHILVSLGTVASSTTEWREFSPGSIVTENDRRAAIDSFRHFYGLGTIYGIPFPTNNTLTMVTPFNPAARMVTTTYWEKDDPLVRQDFFPTLSVSNQGFQSLLYLKPSQPATNLPPTSLRYMNHPYSPWTGNPNSPTYPELSDRAQQDAGVYSSDHWNFPTNEAPATHWLGRVHRGTPWQTIYLQADVAPLSAWLVRGQDPRTHPTNDWRLAAWLAARMNTNPLPALRSVNTTDVATWAATLDGLTVRSNNLPFANLFDPPQFDALALTSNSPPVSIVAEAIKRTRRQQRGQYFADAGALLATPELSSAAPWLNLSSFDQLAFGLDDMAYETLPAQLLGLVRADPLARAKHAAGGVELNITAFEGHAWRIESSTNLTTWTALGGPHQPTNGTFTLTVPVAGGPAYFRVALEE